MYYQAKCDVARPDLCVFFLIIIISFLFFHFFLPKKRSVYESNYKKNISDIGH